MLVAPVAICALAGGHEYLLPAQTAFSSFPHFWFTVSLVFTLIALMFCGVSFYRRDVWVALYALIGGVFVFAYLILLCVRCRSTKCDVL
jgi:hypothetical protein